jgi:hypothetical protein
MLVLVETLPVLEGTLAQDSVDYWHLYGDCDWILKHSSKLHYMSSSLAEHSGPVVRVYAELEGSSLTWWLLNKPSYV